MDPLNTTEEVKPPVDTTQAGTDQVNNPVTEPKQEVNDWTQDERHEKMWKKDPNGLYKSYRELEKVHSPLKEKHTALEIQVGKVTELFKQFGVEPTEEQIKGVFEELKSFKDPDNPVVSNGTFLSEWLEDSEFNPTVVNFFNDLQAKKAQRDFPGWTKEQIEAHNERDTRLKTLESKQKENEQKEQVETAKKSIADNFGKIKQYSDEIGFTFTDDIQKAFMSEAMESKVPPNLLYAFFKDKYAGDIEKLYSEKVKKEQLQELTKIHGKKIVGGSDSVPAKSTGGDSFDDVVVKAFS